MWKVSVGLDHTTTRETKNCSYLSAWAEPQNHSLTAQGKVPPGAEWGPVTNAGELLWVEEVPAWFHRAALGSRHLLDTFLQVNRSPRQQSIQCLYVCSRCQLVSYLGLANKIRSIYWLFLQLKASGPYAFCILVKSLEVDNCDEF